MMFSVLSAVLRDMRRCWRHLAVADLACKSVTFILLAPLVTLLLRAFMAVSGVSWLTDEEILRFVLSPTGIAALAAIATVLAAVVCVELAALMAICLGASGEGCLRWTEGLRFSLRRWRSVAALAGLIVIRLMLVVTPFFAAAGAAGYIFLAEYDINYYLAEKPPAFWKAVALSGALGAAMVIVLARALVRWSIAMPIVLVEERSPAEALRLSAGRTAGNRGRIAVMLVGLLAAVLLLSLAVTGIMGVIGRSAALAAGTSFAALAVTIGALLALNAIVQFLLSALAMAGLSSAVVSLYRHHTGKPGERLPGLPGDRGELSRSLPVRSKALFAVLAGAALFALGFSFHLVNDIRGKDDVLIAAHRGASGAAPENTLAAVALALEEGADYVEVDVQETADGVVVVLHDADLMRLAGVRLNIWDAAYDDLRDLDVGSWFAKEFSDQRIPTLAAVLEMARNRARVNIELKYNGHDVKLAERVVEVVEKAGMASQVVLMSLSYDGVQNIRALRPRWEAGFLSAVAVGSMAKLDADFLAVSTRLATPAFIRSAHRSGRQVHVWTVNDRIGLSAMMDRGVDVIITDEPGLARKVLAERALLSPGERLLVRFGTFLGVDTTTPPVDDA